MDTTDEILSFSALLREAAASDTDLLDPKVEPGQAFRLLYDEWVERGGFLRGKPRHAVWQVKAWLKEEGNDVRSLEPKLAGKTMLPWRDAANLLSVFLAHWTYDPKTSKYEPFPSAQIKETIEICLRDLYPDHNARIQLPERRRISQSTARNNSYAVSKSMVERTRPSGDQIAEIFVNSDALITVSLARSIIGAAPAEAMAGFRNIIHRLFEIDRRVKRRRALIWIVDFGNRENTTIDRAALYNLQFLASHFRSVALIDGDDRSELWSWFQQCAIILVGSLPRDDIDHCYASFLQLPLKRKLDLSWFRSDRLLLDPPPKEWLSLSVLSTFERAEKDRWENPTVTAHFRLPAPKPDQQEAGNIGEQLKYLFHGPVPVEVNGQVTSMARCAELPQPNPHLNDSLKLGCSAAFGRLGWRWDEAAGPVSPTEALAQLRRQNFAALKLHEFCQLPDTILARMDASNDR